MLQHPRRGLTLLEMLVVASIIALLAALLLPSLSRARQQARRMLCAANLRGSGNALNVYRTEMGRYPDVGDRDPRKVFGPTWKPGDPKPSRAASLDNIGDLAEGLVSSSLGDPRALYCPVSLQDDRNARGPYSPVKVGGKPTQQWRSGQISFVYLVGIDYTYPTAGDVATFFPSHESPDRRLNKDIGRAVLIGDRTVVLGSGWKNVAGSNHQRQGGWFYHADGSVRWWPWDRLIAHPTPKYIYYWPRTIKYAPDIKSAAIIHP